MELATIIGIIGFFGGVASILALFLIKGYWPIKIIFLIIFFLVLGIAIGLKLNNIPPKSKIALIAITNLRDNQHVERVQVVRGKAENIPPDSDIIGFIRSNNFVYLVNILPSEKIVNREFTEWSSIFRLGGENSKGEEYHIGACFTPSYFRDFLKPYLDSGNETPTLPCINTNPEVVVIRN